MVTRTTRTIVKRIFIVCSIVVIVLYTLYQTRNLLKGPQLTVLSPENGALSTDSLIEIKGKAANIAYISLNDRQIFMDQTGVFSEKLLLHDGYNIMKLKAKDKFGREVEKILELVYDKSAQPIGIGTGFPVVN